MKATIEIPDELYRRVKAKSALEGRPVRAVTEELYRRWLGEDGSESGRSGGPERSRDEPDWFGALGKYGRRVSDHELDSIRASIARGIAEELEDGSRS